MWVLRLLGTLRLGEEDSGCLAGRPPPGWQAPNGERCGMHAPMHVRHVPRAGRPCTLGAPTFFFFSMAAGLVSEVVGEAVKQCAFGSQSPVRR